jgi:hypothetical protein
LVVCDGYAFIEFFQNVLHFGRAIAELGCLCHP